ALRMPRHSQYSSLHSRWPGFPASLQTSLLRSNVASLFGSGIVACSAGSANCAKRANCFLLPCVTVDASSRLKSQKKRKGVDAENSSPRKRTGGGGGSGRRATGAGRRGGWAAVP